MIRDNLPALQIVVPLVTAPLLILLRRRGLVTAFVLLATWITFGISLALLHQVLTDGPFAYALGGWAAPWGIEYRVDLLSGFVLVLVSGIGAFVCTYSPLSVALEVPYRTYGSFYAMFMLCLTGLLGITITGDMFNVFVFLEVSALSSYVLISMGSDRRALPAAYRYLIMGTIGATFILIGVGLLYMMTGTLNMADMAGRLDSVEHTRTVIAAFGFLTVGIALKMALFPLHLWLPNAYAYSPSVVSAFIAATSTKVSVYLLIRVFLTVFGVEYAFRDMPLVYVVMPLALIGIVSGSLVAVFQNNVKRMLAYSSIAQVGYMVLGISMASVTGLTGGIVHLFNHGLMKGALFLAMGAIFYRAGSVHIDDLKGIGKRMPVTTAVFVVGGLGLIGVPLTVGFISKWYLVSAALQQGLWWVALIILFSSLLALIYVWRVVEVAYFEAPPEGREAVDEVPLSMLVPMSALAAATVVFGINTEFTAGVARAAAEMLLGVGG
jgi:multicomponent Na+:H+ antiporter subunit D